MVQKIGNNYKIIADTPVNVNLVNNQQSMIDWSIFDKIICIHYLPYKDRLKPIKTELSRIGILDLPQFEWYYTIDNEFYQYILKGIPTTQIDLTEVSQKNIKYTIDSYSLLKKLSLCEYKHILIIEDDVCFRKDLSFIKAVIKSTPEDFDIVNYDPWIYDKNSSQLPKYNEYLYQYSNERIYCTSCIAFSQKAIQTIINEQNNILRPFDHYTWIKGYDLHKYCAIDNMHICVQNLGYADRQNKYDVSQNMLYSTTVKNNYCHDVYKQPYFSICVPSYNSQTTIISCIESILCQENDNIEIIIVDDGSVDDEYSLLVDQYSDNSTIKIIQHKQNLGSLAAKVNAVINSKGKFVVIVDSDDTLQPKALDKLQKLYEQNPYLDIVQFGINCAAHGIEQYFNNKFDNLFSNDSIKQHFVNEIQPKSCKMCHNVIGKSYNGQLIRYVANIIWEKISKNNLHICMSDDLILNTLCAVNANSALFLDERLYNYSLGGMSTQPKRPLTNSDIVNNKNISILLNYLVKDNYLSQDVSDKIKSFQFNQIMDYV